MNVTEPPAMFVVAAPVFELTVDAPTVVDTDMELSEANVKELYE